MRLRLSCVQAMPIFQGSLVDGLLNELSTRLSLAPELIETFDLSDVPACSLAPRVDLVPSSTTRRRHLEYAQE